MIDKMRPIDEICEAMDDREISKSIPSTPAGRLAVLEMLFNSEAYDENGSVIAVGEPLLTEHECLQILHSGFPPKVSPHQYR